MLTALISVCSLATVSNLGDCTRGALDLVYVSARSPAGTTLRKQARRSTSALATARAVSRHQFATRVALASRPRRRRDCRVLTDDGGVLQLHFTVHAMWGGRQLQHRCVLAFR
jgi:hypothetical protein